MSNVGQPYFEGDARAIYRYESVPQTLDVLRIPGVHKGSGYAVSCWRIYRDLPVRKIGRFQRRATIDLDGRIAGRVNPGPG